MIIRYITGKKEIKSLNYNILLMRMLFKGSYKAAKLIKISMEIENNIIKYIRITGDFFMYPEDSIRKLEKILIGAPLNKSALYSKISEFFHNEDVQVPLISPEDFVKAILKSKPEV